MRNNTRKVKSAISRSARVLFLIGILSSGGAAQPGVSVAGRVLDEDRAPVPSADVRFRASTNADFDAATSPSGGFTLHLPAGRYTVTVTHAGFHSLTGQSVEILPDTPPLQLVLNHINVVFETIDVPAEPPAVDPTRTQQQSTLTNLEIVNVPYTGRDLSGALRLMPSTLQDSLGVLHLSGSSPNQVEYTLDGFNITDPVSGQLNLRMNIDTVRSLEYSSGRYSPESGKGSAGTVAIATTMGSDKLLYNVTNFVPGIDTASGIHVGTWSPRFVISGPLVKGKAWFSESAQAAYSQAVVEDVPGNNRVPTLQTDNLLRTQINLTPSNLLFASFLVNRTAIDNSGLSALDPFSTTVDRRSRAWFFSVKHDKSFANGALFEWGYAEHRTLSRQIPQGDGLYLITPYGRQGNFFVNSTERANRRQLIASLAPHALHRLGIHQLKAGIDVDRLDYSADNRRTAYETYGLNGARFNHVAYLGNQTLDQRNLEVSAWIVDQWRPRPWLTIEPGVRFDWDELLRNVAPSPRIAATAAPFGWKNAWITAGYAITRDVTSLQLFSRPLDQISVSTQYNPDGSVSAGPLFTYFIIPPGHLRTPYYRNLTGAFERRLAASTTLNVKLSSKRGVDGLSYLPSLDPRYANVATVFELRNYRRDVIDSVEVSVHQRFRKEYEWTASYTRSRAFSNSVVDLAVDSPVWITDNVGRMPWDTPNRILGWAYLPTPWTDWAISCFVDARNGFPFSVQTDQGVTIGEVNSIRYPAYFDLDLHVERKFRIGKRRVALRGGFNNITNHRNPTTVNNVLGAPQFMQFYGSSGRHVVFRIRWLGEAEK